MDALVYVLVALLGFALGLFGPTLWVRLRVRADVAPSAGTAQLVDIHGREIARMVLYEAKREIVKYHGRGPNTRYVFRGVNKQGLHVYQEAPRG